jgi:hypothetical protein
MLTVVASTIGTTPEAIVPDELGVLLPELERRLRELAPGDRIDESMRGVQHVLLGWDVGT